ALVLERQAELELGLHAARLDRDRGGQRLLGVGVAAVAERARARIEAEGEAGAGGHVLRRVAIWSSTRSTMCWAASGRRRRRSEPCSRSIVSGSLSARSSRRRSSRCERATSAMPAREAKRSLPRSCPGSDP